MEIEPCQFYSPELLQELKNSTYRLRTVLPILPEEYKKSVEVQINFNESLLDRINISTAADKTGKLK